MFYYGLIFLKILRKKQNSFLSFVDMMAQIIRFSDFMQQQDFFVHEAKKGKIFIYPTDTIYGIGAVANEANILKISQIKKRDIKKLISIIVPDFTYASLVE